MGPDGQLILEPTGGSAFIEIRGTVIRRNGVAASGEELVLRSVRIVITRPISMPTPKNTNPISATGP